MRLKDQKRKAPPRKNRGQTIYYQVINQRIRAQRQRVRSIRPFISGRVETQHRFCESYDSSNQRNQKELKQKQLYPLLQIQLLPTAKTAPEMGPYPAHKNDFLDVGQKKETIQIRVHKKRNAQKDETHQTSRRQKTIPQDQETRRRSSQVTMEPPSYVVKDSLDISWQRDP